jgi:hypothetical protein
MKQTHLLPFVLLFCLKSYSQSVFAPLNQDYSHFIDRQEIISGKVSNEVHTSFKPFLRQSVYKMTEQVEKDSSVNLSKRDKFNMKYLKDDNWEWADSADTAGNSKKALLKVFYQKKNAFLQYRHPYFEVQANPIFYEMGGKERNGTQTNYMNSRGLELRGMIDKKIGFYTAMTTTQAIFPSYVNERIFNGRQSYIPGEGYFKPYKVNGVDYYSARGYITFKATKHIQLQLGHDRNFVGNGYRTFILSDFTAPYTFAKIQAKVWKFQYTLMFANLFYNTNIGKDTTYSRKFMTFHHLSLNVGKHLNVGFFESIIYNRENNQFDPNYMVPVIFFRYVETYMGSSDKVTLGFDFKLNFARHFSTYGQIVLNEFKINELKNGNGWWGNKYALQLGLKYIDVGGVKNLDLQLEGNLARPYTYSSVDGKNSYSHYNQPLAHPQGANFVEMVALLRYQAHKRVFIQLKGILTRIGYNDTTTNYGSNILIPYANVVTTREYGNYITQGIATNIGYAELNITYMIRHNLFLDLTGMVREQITDKDDPALRRSTLFGSMALRLNMWQRPNDF